MSQLIADALATCAKEPVHIPGAIQSYGVLVSLNTDDLTIETISENCQSLLGLRVSDLLGQSIGKALRAESRARLRQAIERLTHEKVTRTEVVLIDQSRRLACSLSMYKGKCIVEFEDCSIEEVKEETGSFFDLAIQSIEKLRSSQTLHDLYQRTLDEIRRLSGFDRVVVYKFDEHWNGHVASESRSEDSHTYLDLRFPASDIPEQVRDLYSINPIRYIPSTIYKPSRLIGLHEDAPPLDLSLSVLRNVSPIHVEYLKNMEVTASMSLSITKNSKLWGLISCSHESGPNYTPFAKRSICQFLAATLSSLLPQFEDREDTELRLSLGKIQNQLITKMAESERFMDPLFDHPDLLIELTNASGAAFYLDGEWRCAGEVPDLDLLNRIKLLVSKQTDQSLFVADHLSAILKMTPSQVSIASGCMGCAISRAKTNYLLWFRPEVVRTVAWGGNPNAKIELRNDQQVLHPRKSFEAWKETVRGKSRKWAREEIECADNFRLAISDIVLQRVEQITKLNAELEKSNVELDSFAYAASHDLKEPLRGISNYTSMVLGDQNTNLSERSRERLDTVLRLTQRSESLINSLLGYSQLGRQDLKFERVNLNDVVRAAVESVNSKIVELKADVNVEPLPFIFGDKTQLIEVFTNLIVNALKYNTSPNREVSIRYLKDRSTDGIEVISVNDNGIGIEPRFSDAIFKIFKRLHAKDEFGGGSGTGLTIVKKILDRHSASIKVESVIGEGSSFVITFNRQR